MSDPPPIRYLDSLYAATPREVLRQVAQTEPDLSAVMVVGHNPTAQELAIELVDRHDKAGRKLLERQTLATCALVVYRFRAKSWGDLDLGEGSVVAFLVPPYLTSLGTARIARGPAQPGTQLSPAEGPAQPSVRTTRASPWPPPPHSAAAPVPPPRRRSS